MILKEFFRRARRGRKWRVDPRGTIRCQRGDSPLAAVAMAWSPSFAAERLEFRNREWAYKIAAAADVSDSKYRPWLLKQLGIRA